MSYLTGKIRLWGEHRVILQLSIPLQSITSSFVLSRNQLWPSVHAPDARSVAALF